jgi:undecaprenyl-diphosphatase
MFLGLLVLWIVDGKIKREQALHALISSIIAWVVVEMLKSLTETTRPFVLDGSDPLTLTIPNGHAFPSAHTAVAFAIAVTIWLHDRAVGYVFILLALLVGVGRIMANVHSPIDIIGGAVVGVIVALTVENLHPERLISKKH